MISIDASMFPQLNTRKALIVVDPQNDFLCENGALPIRLPTDLTERIVQLVKDFRPFGDVVWVRSEYDRPRLANSEQILIADVPAPGQRRAVPRGRRPAENPQGQDPTTCAEAFLSGSRGAETVRKDTPGAQFHPSIEELVDQAKDITVVKSHYSAFKSQQLMQRLRMRFVTEIYLCGSLTNIGVHATAMDAASHGVDITIIDDCCGYRNPMRHSTALKQMRETTGCEILSAQKALDLLRPQEKAAKAPEAKSTARYLSVRQRNNADAPSSSSSSHGDLTSSFTGMSLSNDAVAALQPDPEARAKTGELPFQSILAEQRQARLKAMPNARTNVRLPAEKPSNSSDSEDEARADSSTATTRGSAVQAQAITDTDVREEKIPETTDGSADVVNGKERKVEKLTNDSECNCSESVVEANKVSAEEETASEPSIAKTKTDILETETLQVDDSSSSKGAENSESEPSKMEAESKQRKESEPLCEGDTKVIYNILPDPLCENIFKRIRDEVQWHRMSHQGGEVPRLVAVQGEVDEDGTVPIYRHPADESPPLLPWSATVREVKDTVEKVVGHPLNHALLQFYRDGNDFISEHSDKTLDIVKDSFIVNVSLGAERTMVLRTKRPPRAKDMTMPVPNTTGDGPKRDVVRAPLPHNSMCQMGLKTNMRWLHAIRQDKRMDRDKTAAELAFEGQRISLTFRRIGTFLDEREGVQRIWGQGAKTKSHDEAHDVVNGQTQEAVEMLRAFGRENQNSEFDWNETYGGGFDVLHISASPRLFLSVDDVVNMRIQLMLAEYGVGYARGSMGSIAPPSPSCKDKKANKEADQDKATPDDAPIKFVDDDSAKSTVQGDLAIMMYLCQVYGKSKEETTSTSVELAQNFTRLQRGLGLLAKRRAVSDINDLKRELEVWDGFAADADFISVGSSSAPGLADFAVWPVLHDMAKVDDGKFLGLENMKRYYLRMLERYSRKKVPGLASVGEKKTTSGEKTTPDKEAAAKEDTPGKETAPEKGTTIEEETTPEKETTVDK